LAALVFDEVIILLADSQILEKTIRLEAVATALALKE